jgi:ribose 5-phosphate isomerase B
MKEIILASDHAGFAYKELIKKHLVQLGVTIIDVGTYSDESVDYPAIIRKGCYEVLEYNTFGIVFGGSGNGEAIAANKINGIRCGLAYSNETARLARAHNNANVLSIGARMCTSQQAIAWVDIFLNTEFDGGRHERRVQDLEVE